MISKQLDRLILFIGFLAFFTNGDNYAAAPLLINISKDLHISISSAALSVTSYMLFFGLLTIVFGPLGDRFGKLRILKIAAFGTSVLSIACAFATSLPMLISLRAVNGAFAAGILPVTIAFVGENSAHGMRQNIIGKVMGMMFLGGAAATVIGGVLAFAGSWRLVYSVYGIAELILALGLLKVADTGSGKNDKLSFGDVYWKALSNKSLIMVICIILLIGFSVLGSFAYLGKLIQDKTGFNILFVGLMLSFYGIGTLAGGKNAGTIRKKIGNRFLVYAGILGFISLFSLAFTNNLIITGAALTGFGMSFIFLQSTLVTVAQELLPNLRGTVMSLISFSMVIGGSLGTSINGFILNYQDTETIFLIASGTLILAGFLAGFLFKRIEDNQYNEEGAVPQKLDNNGIKPILDSCRTSMRQKRT